MESKPTAPSRVLVCTDNLPALRVLRQWLDEIKVPHEVVPSAPELLQATLIAPTRALFMDEDMPVLSSSKILDILRANPTTANLPVFLLGSSEPPLSAGRNLEIFLPRRIEPGLLKQIQATLTDRELPNGIDGDAAEFETNLREMGLFDVFEMLQQSGRTGILDIRGNAINGTVAVVDGQSVHAEVSTGRITGEKAFFRLLSQAAGRAVFRTTPESVVRTIHRTTTELLLDGARQSDELMLLRPRMEPILSLEITELGRNNMGGLTPEQRDLMLLVQYHIDLREIVDRSPMPDLQVMQTLLTLIDNQMLRPITSIRKSLGEDAELLPNLLAQICAADRERITVLAWKPASVDHVRDLHHLFRSLDMLDDAASIMMPGRIDGNTFVLQGKDARLCLLVTLTPGADIKLLGPRVRWIAVVEARGADEAAVRSPFGGHDEMVIETPYTLDGLKSLFVALSTSDWNRSAE